MSPEWGYPGTLGECSVTWVGVQQCAHRCSGQVSSPKDRSWSYLIAPNVTHGRSFPLKYNCLSIGPPISGNNFVEKHDTVWIWEYCSFNHLFNALQCSKNCVSQCQPPVWLTPSPILLSFFDVISTLPYPTLLSYLAILRVCGTNLFKLNLLHDQYTSRRSWTAFPAFNWLKHLCNACKWSS